MIPSDHSYIAVRKQISRFLDEFEDKETLLIVYYGGRTYFIIPLLRGAKYRIGTRPLYASSTHLLHPLSLLVSGDYKLY